MKKSALSDPEQFGPELTAEGPVEGESKGFTLIELLVVVAIIAILTVLAISLFVGVQQKARDGRRQTEIDALAKSLEARKNPTDQTYIYLAANYDADYPGPGAKPQDPTPGNIYCIASSTAPTPPTVPAAVWTTACPAGYSTLPTSGDIFTDLANIASWRVCASLQATSTVFCKASLTQ